MKRPVLFYIQPRLLQNTPRNGSCQKPSPLECDHGKKPYLPDIVILYNGTFYLHLIIIKVQQAAP